MLTLQNVLLATDFSETSTAALDYARDLTQAFRARLHVLHVLEDLASRAWTTDVYVASLPAIQDEMASQARKRLDAVLTAEERQKLNARLEIRTGSPFVEIIRYARDEKIDLIVMGTHGRGPMAHLLLGSVAERVVRKAPCAVLTVRPAEHKYVQP
jgi:nucleotide-binding universal stress UspA family protein